MRSDGSFPERQELVLGVQVGAGSGVEGERILSGRVWWMRGFGFPQRAHRKCRNGGYTGTRGRRKVSSFFAGAPEEVVRDPPSLVLSLCAGESAANKIARKSLFRVQRPRSQAYSWIW